MNRALIIPALYLSLGVVVVMVFIGSIKDSTIHRNLEQRRITIESLSR